MSGASLLYGVAEVAVKKTSREVLLGWLVAAFVILLKQLRGAGRFQIVVGFSRFSGNHVYEQQ